MSAEDESCRIDVWLWRARFFKSRALAAHAVEKNGVRLARGSTRSTLEKPSRQVRIGDGLSFPLGAGWMVLRVESLGERRGPATEARGLYVPVEAEPRSVASGSNRQDPEGSHVKRA